MNRDVKKYLEAVPEARRSHVTTLHALILECFPDCVVDMRYKMPTYSHGEGWVAVASQKSYVSLYTCSATHLTGFKKKHPDYKTGKGCINFRQSDAIPAADVEAVIRHAISHPKDDWR